LLPPSSAVTASRSGHSIVRCAYRQRPT
jgi:hypothetical protein